MSRQVSKCTHQAMTTIIQEGFVGMRIGQK
jgi:hypothetical protein